jgi:hypothetical protein
MFCFYTIVIILYCDADTIANVMAMYTLMKELSTRGFEYTLVPPRGGSSNVEKKYCLQLFHLLGLLFIVSMNYPRHDMIQIYQFYLMDQIKRGCDQVFPVLSCLPIFQHLAISPPSDQYFLLFISNSNGFNLETSTSLSQRTDSSA